MAPPPTSNTERAPGTLFGVVAGLLAIPQALLIADIVAGVVSAGTGTVPISTALGWLTVTAIMRAASGWASDTLALTTTSRTKANIRRNMVERLLAAGPSRLERERTGELAVTMVSGLDHLDAYAGAYHRQRVLALVVPVSVLLVTLRMDPWSALVLALTGPLIPLFMVLLGSAAREQSQRQWLALARLSARFLDAVQAIPTLVAFGQSGQETARIREAIDGHRRLTLRVLRTAFLSALVLEWLATLGTAIVAVEVGLRLLYDRLAWPPALAVLLLAPEFYRPLRLLGGSFHAALAGREVTRRLAILNRDLERAPSAPAPPLDATAPAIGLDDVTVHRDGATAPVIEGLTLQVQRGEWVAIVGPSGAGKSTLLHLLLGFVTPSRGTVHVAGAAVDQAHAAATRRQLTWVPQRPHLFRGTVRANLLLANPAAEVHALQAALNAAAFDEVVGRLRDGLDTELREDGAGLSGGEAQRLAIARALLKGAPILLMDEPTSELDPATEQRVLAALRAMAGTTRIMVTHRLAAARWADRVVVLEAGRIRESGPPLILARGQGPFARLWAAVEGQ